MTNTTPTITIIPASISHNIPLNSPDYVKKRVAAYARVSTDKDDQQNSFDGQVEHWTSRIRNNPEWEFVGMYSDEAVSGTSTKGRDGFKSMIKDALDGKIDLICTKSVSRFARNTVDTLTTIRKLKERGVEVFFEKETIYTMDSKGELLITIMSSLAQEESRSISENVKIGIRYGFLKGKVYMPYKHFLGYQKGEDGKPEIVEKDAEIVRLIYRLYLEGKTQNAIARHLTDEGIPTPSGKTVWSVSTVLSILQNEKYKGDAILQKGYTDDFLTKRRVVNDGTVIPRYYVEHSHPAIITPEVYDLVQEEIRKRKGVGRRQSAVSCFSTKIICGDCGSFYGPKVWHSTSKYRRTIWQCNGKFDSDGVCRTLHLYEPQIQQAFVKAFSRLAVDKERIIAEYSSIIDTLTDTEQLKRDIYSLTEECAVVRELISRFVGEHTFSTDTQDEDMARYERLVAGHDELAKKLQAAIKERTERSARRETLTRFLDSLRDRDGMVVDFDEELWTILVESMTISSENEARFTFKDGREVCVTI